MRGALALVLVLLAGIAGAQGTLQTDSCRPPVLSLQEAPDELRPGGGASILFAIENPNGAPVDAVRATITTTAPAGWTATPAQRELTLGPRNVSVSVLAITAPARGTGVAEGNVTLLVSFVCTQGDIQTSASTTTSLEVRIERFSVPWPLVLSSFVVLALGVTVLGLRRLRRGVALIATTPERPIEPGKSAKFTFLVENRRGKPQKLRFRAAGLPEGWTIHLALTDVDLEPGEEKTIWAIVRAPATAQEGQEVQVELRLVDAGGEGASSSVRAKVVPTP